MGLYYYIKLAREDKKDQPKVKKNRIITKTKPQPQSHFKFTKDRTKKNLILSRPKFREIKMIKRATNKQNI